MKLVFFRHGEALPIQEACVSLDQERPLSENGKIQVLESLKKLKSENFFPEIILSSPYKRAAQTSELISNFYNCKKIIFLEEIAKPTDFKSLIELIIKNSEYKNTIVVGHQPTLGITTRILTNEEEIVLKTAGYALVEVIDTKELKATLKSNFNL